MSAMWTRACQTSRSLSADTYKTQLQNDGYCVIPNLFELSLVTEMQSVAAELAEAQAADAAKRQQYTGSLISLTAHSVFARMLCNSRVRSAFAGTGKPHRNS